MRTRYMLVGASQLEPLQQGQLSNMCGLYSILNAVQLSLYPHHLKKPDLQHVYRYALGHLSRQRELAGVLGVGMGYDLWTELCDEVIAYINAVYGTLLKPVRILTGTAAIDRERAIKQIKRTLRRGRPVLTHFGGALDHYSVFCGYREDRLFLFDSSGLRWVQTNNVGLGERSNRTHWILPDYTRTLCQVW